MVFDDSSSFKEIIKCKINFDNRLNTLNRYPKPTQFPVLL